MRDHIINLLEERPLATLSAAELDIIKAHAAECCTCLQAYEAAKASLRLLQERKSVIEPPPFFQTRVMAAIREQNLAAQPLGLSNLWQAVRPLVASLGAFVALLLALTFLTDRSQRQTEPSELAFMNDDSPEWAVAVQGYPDDEMSYSQALTVLYDPAISAGDTDGK
jgi:hypothetical protein